MPGHIQPYRVKLHILSIQFFASEASPDRWPLSTLLDLPDPRKDLKTKHINLPLLAPQTTSHTKTPTVLGQGQQTWDPSLGLTSAASFVPYLGDQGVQTRLLATSPDRLTAHTRKGLASVPSGWTA